MLQKLDTEHLNRLALAEALASMKQLRLRHARPPPLHLRPCAAYVSRTLVLCWGVGEPAQCRCRPARAFD